jgi:hypothetical protein
MLSVTAIAMLCKIPMQMQDEQPRWMRLGCRTRDRSINTPLLPSPQTRTRCLLASTLASSREPLRLLSLERTLSKPSCTIDKIPTSRDRPTKLTTTTPNHLATLATPVGKPRSEIHRHSPGKNLISDQSLNASPGLSRCGI